MPSVYFVLCYRLVKNKTLTRHCVTSSVQYLLQGGGEADTVAGVGHLVDQAHVLLHGVHHVSQRVLLH